MGWRYQYMPYGVSDSDGHLTFYRNYDVVWGSLAEEWGFSTTLHGAAVQDQEVLVNIIDLSKWLDEHILKQDIPEKNDFNVGPPLIVMKMDIEGSEYAVLEHMIDTGTAYTRVNYIFGEWHPVSQVIKGHNYSTPEELEVLRASLLGYWKMAVQVLCNLTMRSTFTMGWSIQYLDSSWFEQHGEILARL
jgi:hypothetical protein